MYFCKHIIDMTDELRYGKIDLNKINKNTKDTNKNITKEVTKSKNKKIIEVEYINIDDIDYLYNPTKYIYDFETNKKLVN